MMCKSTVSQKNQQDLVDIQGHFTAAIVTTLQSSLRQVVSQVNEVIFDFSHCTMLDSSGIGLMIATCNTLAEKSGKVRVVNASQNIAGILASMRLTKRLNVNQEV
jgi:anti-anti-sigma factor